MRKIERHFSNQGSVVTFDMFGKKVHLFVPDAKYRSVNILTTSLFEVKPHPQLCINLKLNKQNIYFNLKYANDNFGKEIGYLVHDDDLCQKYPKLSKLCADNIPEAEIILPSSYTQELNINRLYVPNIYELMVLYLEADRIDALDPTISSNEYKRFALGYRNTFGRFNFEDNCIMLSCNYCSQSEDIVWYGITCNGRLLETKVGKTTNIGIDYLASNLNLNVSVIPVTHLTEEQLLPPKTTRSKKAATSENVTTAEKTVAQPKKATKRRTSKKPKQISVSLDDF